MEFLSTYVLNYINITSLSLDKLFELIWINYIRLYIKNTLKLWKPGFQQNARLENTLGFEILF